MRSKLLSGVTALALTAGTVLASSAPASAQWGWHRGWGGWGWGGGAIAAGILGGAALAAATSPYWGAGYYDYAPGYAYSGYAYPGAYAYAPGYAYSPAFSYGADYGYGGGYTPAVSYGGVYDYAPAPYVAAGTTTVGGGGDVAYCRARYRSYNPSTGMFLGVDGQRHPCP
jgi:BA14K-like protein